MYVCVLILSWSHCTTFQFKNFYHPEFGLDSDLNICVARTRKLRKYSDRLTLCSSKQIFFNFSQQSWYCSVHDVSLGQRVRNSRPNCTSVLLLHVCHNLNSKDFSGQNKAYALAKKISCLNNLFNWYTIYCIVSCSCT